MTVQESNKNYLSRLDLGKANVTEAYISIESTCDIINKSEHKCETRYVDPRVMFIKVLWQKVGDIAAINFCNYYEQVFEGMPNETYRAFVVDLRTGLILKNTKTIDTAIDAAREEAARRALVQPVRAVGVSMVA